MQMALCVCALLQLISSSLEFNDCRLIRSRIALLLPPSQLRFDRGHLQVVLLHRLDDVLQGLKGPGTGGPRTLATARLVESERRSRPSAPGSAARGRGLRQLAERRRGSRRLGRLGRLRLQLGMRQVRLTTVQRLPQLGNLGLI